MNKKLLSTSEVADILGISREAVLKKITKGQLPAKKVGRNFVIAEEDLPIRSGGEMTETKKLIIDAAIRKTIKDYKRTLELLGKE